MFTKSEIKAYYDGKRQTLKEYCWIKEYENDGWTEIQEVVGSPTSHIPLSLALQKIDEEEENALPGTTNIRIIS
jgi:hypothetical protein